MKKYKVIKYTLGNDADGKRAWINPVESGTRNLDSVSADEFNSQFGNTGVKYELVEESAESGEETSKVTIKRTRK